MHLGPRKTPDWEPNGRRERAFGNFLLIAPVMRPPAGPHDVKIHSRCSSTKLPSHVLVHLDSLAEFWCGCFPPSFVSGTVSATHLPSCPQVRPSIKQLKRDANDVPQIQYRVTPELRHEHKVAGVLQNKGHTVATAGLNSAQQVVQGLWRTRTCNAMHAHAHAHAMHARACTERAPRCTSTHTYSEAPTRKHTDSAPTTLIMRPRAHMHCGTRTHPQCTHVRACAHTAQPTCATSPVGRSHGRGPPPKSHPSAGCSRPRGTRGAHTHSAQLSSGRVYHSHIHNPSHSRSTRLQHPAEHMTHPATTPMRSR